MPRLPAPADPLHRYAPALFWLAMGGVALWLLALLSPILSPFLLAGILAYICNPAVAWLTRRRLPRSAAAALVILALGLLLFGLALVMLPLLVHEVRLLADRLPQVLNLLQDKGLPWLNAHFGLTLSLEADALKTQLTQLVSEHRDSIQAVAGKLLTSLRIGGVALMGLVTTLLLTPLVMFYLLVEWDGLLARIDRLVPRPRHALVTRVAAEVDAVLAEFLRGQLSVMLMLAVFYSLALWVAGIDFALPIGIMTGLLVVIPYLGYAAGLILALLVALLQGPEPGGLLLGVAIVFALGQVLEGFVLTPWLVGERIGLHPLAVIFALLAFGEIFGFFGVLAALPLSAALLVGLREMKSAYLESRFYTGDAT